MAYNFVPGGSLTREHTDYVIILTMGGIGLGLYAGRKGEDGTERGISEMFSAIFFILRLYIHVYNGRCFSLCNPIVRVAGYDRSSLSTNENRVRNHRQHL